MDGNSTEVGNSLCTSTEVKKMKTQTFIGNDIRQALAMAREAMGSDAIVVSTRRIGDKTEVIARAEGILDNARLESPLRDSRSQMKDDHVSSIIRVIQDEVNRLRDMFQSELQHIGWREMATKQPAKFELVKRLLVCGFSRQAAGVLVDRVMPCDNTEQGWAGIKDCLRKHIPVAGNDLISEGGIFALVGCTGVGKTTTAAKLAGQFAKQHGFRQVAFISTDKYKIGGHEQLVSLGSLFGIPVQAVNNAEEMEKTIYSLSSKKLIIIDTAGISQRDSNLHNQFNMLRISIPIKPLLVLPAPSRSGVIKETIDSFRDIQPVAAILTKIDEADCIGPILANLITSRLALAYVSNGQNVPDDLLCASTDMVIDEIEKTYKFAIKKDEKTPAANFSKAV